MRPAASKREGPMFVVSHPVDPKVHEAAIRLARRCRCIVQACLREEEWADADREFYAVIREGLEQFTDKERWGTHDRSRRRSCRP